MLKYYGDRLYTESKEISALFPHNFNLQRDNKREVIMNKCECGCGQLCNKRFVKGHANKGKHFTEKHKEKIRQANKGQKPWNKGLTNCYSEETLIKHKEK